MMMMTISLLLKYLQWPDMSINRTQNTARSHYKIDLRPRDESVWDRDQYFMRPRPRPRPVTVRPRPIPKKWSRYHA